MRRCYMVRHGRRTVQISATPGRVIITWLLPGRNWRGTEPLDGLGLKGEHQWGGTEQSFLLSERVATGNGSRRRIKRDGGRPGRTREAPNGSIPCSLGARARQVGALGEVLAQQAAGILTGSGPSHLEPTAPEQHHSTPSHRRTCE
jgi:hypothetical protein